MEIIQPAAQIIVTLVLIILVINSLYLLIFSVAGSWKRGKDVTNGKNNTENNFLVVFPAYKEDSVIIDSVANFMRQEYSNFRVYVIADQLKSTTIEKLERIGVSVCVLPDFENRNKAKAINYLLGQIKNVYSVCVIMDADNMVADSFLREMNGYFLSGGLAVQAQRVAKNNENNLSKLDGFSETINNHIFRKGQRALGMSASLIGSGMAFEMNLFRELMKDMDVVSGFDKELELRLLEKGIKINYAENIEVYDEKVSDHKVFINQRRRWIFAQIFFLKKNALKAIHHLFVKGNSDYANKVFQFMLLPRILCAGLSILFIPAAYFAGNTIFFVAILNALLMITALIIPLLENFRSKDILKLSLSVPRVFFNMLLAAMTSAKASKKFLHTPHGKTEG